MAEPLPQDQQLKWRNNIASRGRRVQVSDTAAGRYLGGFELRRSGQRGDMGIFLKGTTVRVGTVMRNAHQFARALQNVMEHAARRRVRTAVKDGQQQPS